ncbi:5-amino-6-(5-phosphoribosylamino)uracil reductase [Stackebrandtia albiflava]|uniref:5-amino-6-(5-phosphoribosylamino)uracil reductase n=1 Tax=Stackebrandtia albiflava TaxID=406432 RepID=A0A562VA65_9ACTN|nr:RibD family protein [Stackebrandtia albiflava]TWJ14731.1 5-amino-6-(5-phosphoribosylamino)uracil reductase [Stackebrandtia albiflava]
MNRPYVLLSAATSLDGCLDDTTDRRLLLSNPADFAEVDAERARADAVLVGAGTVRADDPRLLVRSAEARARRLAEGRAESPLKVTVSRRGDLDPDAAFFTAGDVGKLVYVTDPEAAVSARVAEAATVVRATGWPGVLSDLAARGVARLMVEGGASVHRQLLAAGLVDELRLSVAPFLIGDPEAPRFPGTGDFPYGPDSPLRLVECRALGDMVSLRYIVNRTALSG